MRNAPPRTRASPRRRPRCRGERRVPGSELLPRPDHTGSVRLGRTSDGDLRERRDRVRASSLTQNGVLWGGAGRPRPTVVAVTQTTSGGPSPAANGTSRYVEFDREAWSELRAATPLTLAQPELERLRGINERIDLDEVATVYLPLSRLLNLYVGATQDLHRSPTFLGTVAPKVPVRDRARRAASPSARAQRPRPADVAGALARPSQGRPDHHRRLPLPQPRARRPRHHAPQGLPRVLRPQAR